MSQKLQILCDIHRIGDVAFNRQVPLLTEPQYGMFKMVKKFYSLMVSCGQVAGHFSHNTPAKPADKYTPMDVDLNKFTGISRSSK